MRRSWLCAIVMLPAFAYGQEVPPLVQQAFQAELDFLVAAMEHAPEEAAASIVDAVVHGAPTLADLPGHA